MHVWRYYTFSISVFTNNSLHIYCIVLNKCVMLMKVVGRLNLINLKSFEIVWRMLFISDIYDSILKF